MVVSFTTVVAVAAVAAVDDRDRVRWRLMEVAALDGGHTTTSRHSKRATQQENKRATQGEATQQPAHLLLRRHYNMWCCHLSRRQGIT
jgi:hypothetical protein